MIGFWAQGADERLSQLRSERRDRLRSLRLRRLLTRNRDERSALSEEIRAVNERFKEQIRLHRHVLHTSVRTPRNRLID